MLKKVLSRKKKSLVNDTTSMFDTVGLSTPELTSRTSSAAWSDQERYECGRYNRYAVNGSMSNSMDTTSANHGNESVQAGSENDQDQSPHNVTYQCGVATPDICHNSGEAETSESRDTERKDSKGGTKGKVEVGEDTYPSRKMTIVDLMEQVRCLQRRLNQALVESHEATIAASKHAAACCAAAELASKFGNLYSVDGARQRQSAKGHPAIAPNNVDITSILHEAKDRLADAEKKRREAETDLENLRSEHERSIEKSKDQITMLQQSLMAYEKEQEALKEKIRDLKAEQKDAREVGFHLLNEERDLEQISMAELISMVYNSRVKEQDQGSICQEVPFGEKNTISNGSEANSPMQMSGTMYFTALSDSSQGSSENLEGKILSNSVSQSGKSSTSVNMRLEEEIQILRRKTLILRDEIEEKERKYEVLRLDFDEILNFFKSNFLGNEINDDILIPTILDKHFMDVAKFRRSIKRFADAKHSLEEKQKELNDANLQINALTSQLSTMDERRQYAEQNLNNIECCLFGKLIASEATKKALLLETQEQHSEKKITQKVISISIPCTSYSLYVRCLEDQNRALNERIAHFEEELLQTQEMLGHKNSQQRIQYHKKLKQNLETIRKEATNALREKFQLENAVRYLAAMSGYMPEVRHPADAIRPESLSGRQGLVTASQEDFNEASKHAEAIIQRKIAEVCLR